MISLPYGQVPGVNHPRHHLDIHAQIDDLGRRILTLAGDVDLRTVGRLRDQIVGQATDGITVVIDLRDVDFMDSPGLGALIHCQRTLAHHGAHLVARAPRGDVLDLLEMTGADEVLRIEKHPEDG